MYNPEYKPETNFEPTPKVTVVEARKKAAYHAKVIQNGAGVLTDDQLMHDYECLNYFNQIILRGGKK